VYAQNNKLHEILSIVLQVFGSHTLKPPNVFAAHMDEFLMKILSAKSFMIFQQELLDAAVSLWRNIIPKEIIEQI
jgi:hypothetical protein